MEAFTQESNTTSQGSGSDEFTQDTSNTRTFDEDTDTDMSSDDEDDEMNETDEFFNNIFQPALLPVPTQIPFDYNMGSSLHQHRGQFLTNAMLTAQYHQQMAALQNNITSPRNRGCRAKRTKHTRAQHRRKETAKMKIVRCLMTNLGQFIKKGKTYNAFQCDSCKKTVSCEDKTGYTNLFSHLEHCIGKGTNLKVSSCVIIHYLIYIFK